MAQNGMLDKTWESKCMTVRFKISKDVSKYKKKCKHKERKIFIKMSQHTFYYTPNAKRQFGKCNMIKILLT